MILAGLSFRIRWQDLIDHAARHDIYVECAVVYPKLGGWLRILDRETFIKAFGMVPLLCIVLRGIDIGQTYSAMLKSRETQFWRTRGTTKKQ